MQQWRRGKRKLLDGYFMNQFRSNRKSFHSLDAVDTSYFETGGGGREKIRNNVENFFCINSFNRIILFKTNKVKQLSSYLAQDITVGPCQN